MEGRPEPVAITVGGVNARPEEVSSIAIAKMDVRRHSIELEHSPSAVEVDPPARASVARGTRIFSTPTGYRCVEHNHSQHPSFDDVWVYILLTI